MRIGLIPNLIDSSNQRFYTILSAGLNTNYLLFLPLRLAKNYMTYLLVACSLSSFTPLYLYLRT